jgi:hypothetical protein
MDGNRLGISEGRGGGMTFEICWDYRSPARCLRVSPFSELGLPRFGVVTSGRARRKVYLPRRKRARPDRRRQPGGKSQLPRAANIRIGAQSPVATPWCPIPEAQAVRRWSNSGAAGGIVVWQRGNETHSPMRPAWAEPNHAAKSIKRFRFDPNTPRNFPDSRRGGMSGTSKKPAQ